jgi:hypothetical protein
VTFEENLPENGTMHFSSEQGRKGQWKRCSKVNLNR